MYGVPLSYTKPSMREAGHIEGPFMQEAIHIGGSPCRRPFTRGYYSEIRGFSRSPSPVQTDTAFLAPNCQDIRADDSFGP